MTSSPRRQRLTATDAADVAELFGIQASGTMTPAARGELGQVWHLPTADGGGVAVKELFVPPTEADAAADVAFQLRARDAGITLPSPVRRADGRVLAELRPGVTIRLYAWVELRPLAERPVEDVGRLLATLHRSASPVTDPPSPWFTQPVGAAAWKELLDSDGAALVPFGAGLAALVPELVALETLLPCLPRGDERRCHLDLDDSNLGWDSQGRLVVLDWENSGPASPVQELAMLAADYGPDQAGRLVDAYRDAGGPAELRSVADFAMAAAVQGHLAEFYTRRFLHSPDEEDRDRSAWRMTELVNRPLTRRGIEEILAAAQTR